jgi:hypothetical protein
LLKIFHRNLKHLCQAIQNLLLIKYIIIIRFQNQNNIKLTLHVDMIILLKLSSLWLIFKQCNYSKKILNQQRYYSYKVKKYSFKQRLTKLNYKDKTCFYKNKNFKINSINKQPNINFYNKNMQKFVKNMRNA